MITIKFNGKTYQVEPNTRVIDLLTQEQQHDYIVCQIGAQIKELKYKLTERNDGMEITLKGLEHIEGGKAYEASLRFIIAMAFRNIYPDVHIKFSYNVSRSIFCQALTPHNFNMYKAVESITQEARRIIDADLPIERVTLPVEEAMQIYRDYDHPDKAEMLKYRPEKTAHLYKCDGYYNYMHSYMVASTGCIKNYRIVPYSPGIIIQYPRYELNATIPEFVEETTYGRTLQKVHTWSQKTKTQTIAEINHKIEDDSIVDFIQMCECKHNDMLSQLGSSIEEDIDNLRLLCIAGPSSSGKTTFCNRLKIELLSRGINPVTISMDDYYLEKSKICDLQNLPIEQLDLEHVDCLDVQLFNRDLFNLINGEEVTLPRFNFVTGKREVGRTIRTDHNNPIIIEGIHALNEKLTSSIPKHQKYKIYIAPQMQVNIDNHSPLNITDLRLIRRIVRDMSFRNCPASTTIDMWQSVRNGEFKWIYPNQEGANFVFNSALPYELCVLRNRALPALREIAYDDPHFLVANRLIKYLKYFKSIEDESIIPCNSLIREFIGGSCFKL
ncbi:MAG: nucleoside kinase [Clostridia bacterium]|nr:nucleoside kinase [Clostridia bacterium]